MKDHTDPDYFGAGVQVTKIRTDLESEIEAKAVRAAKAKDWLSRKFRSPSQRSVPDRLFVRRGVVVFVEFKRPGNRPTAAQEKEMAALRAAGANVFWTDSMDGCLEILGRSP